MRVLSIDQSCTASAAVVLDRVGPTRLKIVSQAVHHPKSKGIERLVSNESWFNKMVRENAPDMLVREMHQQRTFGAANQIHGLAACLDLIAFSGGFLQDDLYARVPVTAWKKFCLGRGNVAKDTAYMLTLNKFFNDTEYLEGIGVDPVADDNIGDAICMGITAFITREILHGAEIGLFKYQRDVMKKIEVAFDYGSA